MDIKKIIGLKILTLRRFHNMKQIELANRLGCGQQCVSGWESGRNMVTIDQLVKICRIFGVSWDFFNPSTPITLEPTDNKKF
ncbi:helix-turn-helix domain-containing protein [Candidatus Uabimicrobium amorphum]|uniref:Transcriptional regulator n=1 Tax=Uabimicrobium amorphum TaxID=2596890 RepID=A0A5S9F2G7_UABAM|nr:helix-turn-helix transcriptional regulator [Candidatus Uabimicrobium amorphum]BBM82092.1 transcriptional regulator [Candidatus Uabimicrobium amorphum]